MTLEAGVVFLLVTWENVSYAHYRGMFSFSSSIFPRLSCFLGMMGACPHGTYVVIWLQCLVQAHPLGHWPKNDQNTPKMTFARHWAWQCMAGLVLVTMAQHGLVTVLDKAGDVLVT